MANDQRHWMRGKVFPVRGRRHPRPGARSLAPPGTWRPTVQWGCQGGRARHWSGGQDGVADFSEQPPQPLCRVEYASVIVGRMPAVLDQDLRRSEAWLGNHRGLLGAIRAVVASPPPQAHRCSHGRGEHLARPRRGARGRVLCRPP